MVTQAIRYAVVLLSLSGALPARAAPQDAPAAREPVAQNSPEAPAPELAGKPALHHAPHSVAPAHTALEITAQVTFPHQVRRAVLVYRALDDSGRPLAWTELDFLRGSPGPYVAVVPASDVKNPGFEYALELELIDGRRVPAFASRAAPFRVSVSEDLMDVRERVALTRLEGRRSVVSSFFEYVSFGRSKTTSLGGGDVHDSYYRVEASYTYRPLRIIDEFSVHVGAVRGHSPVADTSPTGDTSVGLNYAAPSVRWSLSDAFRLETEVLASVTEVGFAVGGGAALDVGDPYGSKWRIGFESIQTFGARIFSQVDIRAAQRLRLSPIIEVTDMPHAGRFGVRLIGEARYQFPSGLGVAVRGGYQARDAASGGPSAGIRLDWAF
jgi:hypothetical protein